ncbi:MAG: polyphosphate polymerase domain-containing protein [Nitrospirae bacterium]|nr:polyphosphate polymerase domain-containing protein [Nitrospirota bacterium]
MIRQFNHKYTRFDAHFGEKASCPSGLSYQATPLPDNHLSRFEPIELAQMDDVAMLDRIETKYVLEVSQLVSFIASLSEHYWLLSIDGIQKSSYQNLYFDSPHFTLYLLHHSGARYRHKVRFRRYVDTDRKFLEVKLKTNKNRTVKQRLETREVISNLDTQTSEFIYSHLGPETRSLEPKLRIDFSRITLVSKYQPERLTLDLDLRFGNDEDAIVLKDLVIAEVKQTKENRNSDFIRQMRTMCIRPIDISKYCIGVSMLYRSIKHNTFKPALRIITKLTGGRESVQ